MSVNISKVFISYFFFIVLAWKFKLGFFFVFFTPAVSFWPSFFAPPSSCCDSRLSCCALNLRLRADDVLFLKKKKQKKTWDLLSCLCNICLKLKMCIFFVFVYTFQRNKGSPFFHKYISHEILLPTQKQRVEKCGKWEKPNLASHVKIMDDTDILNIGCHFLKRSAETLHCNLLFKTWL